MVAIWCRVLAAVPRSRIVIKTAVVQDEAAGNRLRERFAQHGIGADRVELRGWSDTRDVHLAAYGDIDIALDTFPYNGTTTTCEALWMGVPVVTLAGDVHMARVGATLLGCTGLPELVARTDGEYVQTAVALAADAPRRTRLRAAMREQMLASPLLDHRGFARKLEAAYRETWQAWCRRHAGRVRA
jgi:predicted O-linked N-acetylglucosamine transferase (SPINDLY family)